jgi:hypothetical protein
MRKSFIFVYLLVLCNFLSLFANIEFVNAKKINTIQNTSYQSNFQYDITLPTVNNSNANRIAVENFEYDSNTNLSNTIRYSKWGYESQMLVKDFVDIDFYRTNNSYFSKYCEITSKCGGLTYVFDSSLNSLRRLGGLSFSAISKPIDDIAQYFMFYNDTSYFYYRLDYLSGKLFVQSSLNAIYTENNFVPAIDTFDYIYVTCNPLYVFLNYTVQFEIICYNQSGVVVYEDSVLFDLESYTEFKFSTFSYLVEFVNLGVGNISNLIAIDNNFISDRRSEYSAYNWNLHSGIMSFYLTKIPYYSEFYDYTSSDYRYATTIYENRYLRYLTNASYCDFKIFSNNLLNKSFSIKTELSLNNQIEGFQLSYNFKDFAIVVDIAYGTIYLYKLRLSDYTITRQKYYYYSQFDNNSIFHAQYKNKLFTFTFQSNFSVISEQFFMYNDFLNLSIRGYLLNFEYKTLSTDTLFVYSNLTKTEITTDLLTFRDKISAIFSLYQFDNIIVIPPSEIKTIEVNDIEYQIFSQSIINIDISSERSYTDGHFTITNDFEYSWVLFNNNELNYSFNCEILRGKSDGNIFLHADFYLSTNSDIHLKIVLNVNRFLIFTDHIPVNNLWIIKSIEFLIPLLVFTIIIIGFKSNSDSKFLPIIGMFVGIFTLYLMNYMSLLFMILCFVFLSIGVYIIVKKESSGGNI